MTAPAFRSLSTERLVLRHPRPEDAPAYIGFFGSARTRYAGGIKTPDEAWNILVFDHGLWQMRGFGRFVATRKGSDRAIGLFGPYYPFGRPEPEIGWVLFDATDEGQGLATEAARACVAHAFGPLGWDSAVSYIAPENAGSIRLADRLGARLDEDAPQPKPGVHTLVYRHPRPAKAVATPQVQA
ncbi:MAG TPA: N-acetyltransferase [Rhodobacteraceae bacterium]|nr:N-acetyltransferase [Paracoccaceae bacterium]